jgi:hypothetical protein
MAIDTVILKLWRLSLVVVRGLFFKNILEKRLIATLMTPLAKSLQMFLFRQVTYLDSSFAFLPLD